MTRTVVPTSPLIAAALTLVGAGATAAQLERRFRSAGAGLEAGVAVQLLTELASLGLVRVGRPGGDEDAGAEYVVTSLGQQVLDQGPGGENAPRLQELERLRTDLLSTIAHELRTPLTAIRTSAGLLLDPATEPTDEQRRQLLQAIERNADRMQRIVGDILDLTRFRSGAIRLQLRRFDATELAEGVIATVQPLADQRGQTIELAAPRGRGPMVFGDHRRLEQALLNLVSNAQRFSPRDARIEVQVEAAGPAVEWHVADRGPGIAQNDQTRLFERFFVGQNDRNEPRDGVGLGLPTALAIAQAHGGTIEVRSRPGQGSTFSLVVPASGPPGHH